MTISIKFISEHTVKSKEEPEQEQEHRTPDFSGKTTSLSFILCRHPLEVGIFHTECWHIRTKIKCYSFLLLGADVINFDGHVVLPYRFRNKKMKTLKDVIALKFKTSESEGVILHGEGQQGDYITLELKKAKLVFSLNLGMFWRLALFINLLISKMLMLLNP